MKSHVRPSRATFSGGKEKRCSVFPRKYEKMRTGVNRLVERLLDRSINVGRYRKRRAYKPFHPPHAEWRLSSMSRTTSVASTLLCERARHSTLSHGK